MKIEFIKKALFVISIITHNFKKKGKNVKGIDKFGTDY